MFKVILNTVELAEYLTTEIAVLTGYNRINVFSAEPRWFWIFILILTSSVARIFTADFLLLAVPVEYLE